MSKKERDLHLQLLKKFGETGLFEKAVGIGMLQAAINPNSDVDILNASEYFYKMYRQTGNQDYAILSKVLRRTAHKICRELIRQNNKIPDERFLIIVNMSKNQS